MQIQFESGDALVSRPVPATPRRWLGALLVTLAAAPTASAQAWERHYGAALHGRPAPIAQPDGSYVACGYSNHHPMRGVIARLSSQGELLGGFHYHGLAHGEVMFTDGVQLPSGDLAVGASIGARPWIGVFDPNTGQMRFDASFEHVGTVRQLAASADGAVYATARIRIGNYNRAALARWSASGQLEWSREYSELSKTAEAQGVVPLPDGGAVLLASQAPTASAPTDHLLLVKIHPSGMIHWRRRILLSGGPLGAGRVARTPSGDLVVVGVETVSSLEDLRFIWLRFSQYGTLQAARRYQTFPSVPSLGYWPHVESVVALSDGSVVASTRQPFRVGHEATQMRVGLLHIGADGALLSNRLRPDESEYWPNALGRAPGGGLIHGSTGNGGKRVRVGDANGGMPGPCDGSIEVGAFPASFNPTVQTTLNTFMSHSVVTDDLHAWPQEIGAQPSSLLCAPTVVTSYCTTSTSSQNCSPSMAASGAPSVSASAGFTLAATGVDGQRTGLVFYGLSGRAASPWAPGGTSTLCVKLPVQRMSAQSSGGTAGACNGVLAQDWLAFLSANPAALGRPFASGTTVNAQVWFRDPGAPGATNLSDGLEFVTAP